MITDALKAVVLTGFAVCLGIELVAPLLYALPYALLYESLYPTSLESVLPLA